MLQFSVTTLCRQIKSPKEQDDLTHPAKYHITIGISSRTKLRENNF